MAYGGLRGAVTFALVIMLDENVYTHRHLLITTTVVVIYVTNFFLVIINASGSVTVVIIVDRPSPASPYTPRLVHFPLSDISASDLSMLEFVCYTNFVIIIII